MKNVMKCALRSAKSDCEYSEIFTLNHCHNPTRHGLEAPIMRAWAFFSDQQQDFL